jgi:hypothetical protein
MIKKELDLGHDDCNTSNNESFENVLAQRMSRRDVMKMGAGFVGTALFGSFMIGDARMMNLLLHQLLLLRYY